MIRIKLVKNCKQGRAGDVLVIDRNEGFGLIDSGYAVVSKDMTPDDYKVDTTKQAGDKNGQPTQLRTNKPS